MSRSVHVPALALFLGVATAVPAAGQGGFLGRVKQKAQEKLQKKIDSTADTLSGRIVDGATGAVVCVVTNKTCIADASKQGKPVKVTDASGKQVSSADSAKAVVAAGGGTGAAAAAAPAEAPTLKSYQNYDFVPGDSIVFDDDFASDADGEFPAHWKLLDGQAVINMRDGAPAFVVESGLAARVAPRIKNDSYLGPTFTVEFDYYAIKDPWIDIAVELENGGGSGQEEHVDINKGVHLWGYKGVDFNGKYPGSDADYVNHWHHAAFVVKNGQFKAYIDQYRVLVVPDLPTTPTSVQFGGRATPTSLITFRNVRIANGGGMNLIDKLTKDGRIVTHGILFDVNKSDIRPQSMGTIRQIVSLLTGNPTLKLEVDGHTDADGDATANLTLSQARADAVKQALIGQGIDASRLTTKGFGATKPIDSNATPEGKANNRRVEFVKVP